MIDFIWTVKGLLRELALADSHRRVCSNISTAMSDSSRAQGLVRYHDFFETTAIAHLSAMTTCIARLIDRDSRTQSLYWLVSYIDQHPNEFSKDLLTTDLASSLSSVEPQFRKIRKLRNKWYAHRERMTPVEERALFQENLLSTPDIEAVLSTLRAIVEKVTKAHLGYDWRWVMISIDEETDELITAIQRDKGGL